MNREGRVESWMRSRVPRESNFVSEKKTLEISIKVLQVAGKFRLYRAKMR